MPFYSYETLSKMIGTASYNQIGALVTSGKLDVKTLRRYYSRARKIALKRVKRADELGVGFWHKPEFRQIKNLITTADLIREINDVNRFLNAETTVSQRKEYIRKRIDTMHKRGMFKNINTFEDYEKFAKFLDWARATGRLDTYGSESNEIEETMDSVINEKADTSAQFEELFNVVIGIME